MTNKELNAMYQKVVKLCVQKKFNNGATRDIHATAFTVEDDNLKKQFLITAKRVMYDESTRQIQPERLIKVGNLNGWKQGLVNVHLPKYGDLAVLELPENSFITKPSDMRLGLAGAYTGDKMHIMGFPFNNNLQYGEGKINALPYPIDAHYLNLVGTNGDEFDLIHPSSKFDDGFLGAPVFAKNASDGKAQICGVITDYEKHEHNPFGDRLRAFVPDHAKHLIDDLTR